jgi:hypothetical protein
MARPPDIARAPITARPISRGPIGGCRHRRISFAKSRGPAAIQRLAQPREGRLVFCVVIAADRPRLMSGRHRGSLRSSGGRRRRPLTAELQTRDAGRHVERIAGAGCPGLFGTAITAPNQFHRGRAVVVRPPQAAGRNARRGLGPHGPRGPQPVLIVGEDARIRRWPPRKTYVHGFLKPCALWAALAPSSKWHVRFGSDTNLSFDSQATFSIHGNTTYAGQLSLSAMPAKPGSPDAVGNSCSPPGR